jgi:hypothetical protein
VLNICGKTIVGPCKDKEIYCRSKLSFWSCTPGIKPSEDWIVTLEYNDHAYAWDVTKVRANRRGTKYVLRATPYELDGFEMPDSNIRIVLRHQRSRISALLYGRNLFFAGLKRI